MRKRIVKYYTKQYPDYLLVRNHYDDGSVEWVKQRGNRSETLTFTPGLQTWDSCNVRDDAGKVWIQWMGAGLADRTVIKDKA